MSRRWVDLSELSRRLSDLPGLQLCLSGGDLTWIVFFWDVVMNRNEMEWIQMTIDYSTIVLQYVGSLHHEVQPVLCSSGSRPGVLEAATVTGGPDEHHVGASAMWQQSSGIYNKKSWHTTRASMDNYYSICCWYSFGYCSNCGCRRFAGHCWFWACPIMALILQSTMCGCYGLSAFLHLVSLSFSQGLAVVVSEQLWGN